MAKAKAKNISLPIILILVSVLLVSNIITMHNNHKDESQVISNSENKLIVHFLDVGQGDSEFIELPNGECMLIDASTYEYSDYIIDAIEGFGYSKIDYVVATHPHADHIGGMADIVDTFDIGEIYMPKVSADTKTFETLLTVIKNNDLTINTAVADKVICSTDSLDIRILSPISSKYDDLNNYSAVVKLEYGESSFLFTGDAEIVVENELIAKYNYDLDADVLKAGHHGSRYSSSTDFLKYVTPTYTVISCEKNNSYGHPHKEAIDRLNNIKTQIFRTYELGNISISCDDNDNFEVSYD